MSTYLHKIKCLSCSLHFIICSWNKERDSGKVFCPECGKQGNMLHFFEESDEEVFQLVPGGAKPYGFVGKMVT